MIINIVMIIKKRIGGTDATLRFALEASELFNWAIGKPLPSNAD